MQIDSLDRDDMADIDPPVIFGEWLKIRRKALDLTQAELADRAGCSIHTIRKIESGERRPSKQLASLLANSLEIPSGERETFANVARGALKLERLRRPSSVSGDHRATTPNDFPHRSDLPVLPTCLVGRESELIALEQLLHDPHCRLLTLVGPGGIGKTHLAIEVASRHQDLFPDGVHFVSLAPIRSSTYLVPTIADALGFIFQDPVEPGRQLLNFLREKNALLVLDNAEHLLDGVVLFSEILESSPQVQLLVTSRERLNLLSEWVFEITGLPIPPQSQVDRFEDFGSVALFLQIAERTQAGFDLTDENRQSVLRICQLVEGMPLGIQLAATWVRVLSCEEIAREIERSLDFLRASNIDLPERHRSLRATLDHSWNLLSSEEQTVLSRLSVFRGNFNRKSAEQICGADLFIISSLIDKSLLRRAGQERFDLHELIYQYSALRLAEDAHEDKLLKKRHAEYFGRRLSDWEVALKGSKQMETMTEMAQEIRNLRQAWQQMIACYGGDCLHGDLPDTSLFQSSLFSLSLFYEMQCRNWEAVNLFGDAVDRIRTARESIDRPEKERGLETILGRLLAYFGLHCSYILQYERARELLEEALSLLEDSQAKLEKAQAQIMLSVVLRTQGQIQKSIDLLEEALVIFRAEDELWWYALALTHLAWANLSIGKIQESKALYQEGLKLAPPGNLRLRVPIRNGYAYALYLEGDFAEAERLLKENLAHSFKFGNKRQTALCFLDLGQVALATNRIGLAEKNLYECIELLSEFGGSHDLALALVHLGKCLITRQETEAARGKFKQVIRIGQELDIFHLVYWGLVNMARVYLIEGAIDKAYKISLVIQKYSLENKIIHDDANHLVNEVEGRLAGKPLKTVRGRSSADTLEMVLKWVLAG